MSKSVSTVHTSAGDGVGESRQAVVEQFNLFVDMTVDNALAEFEPFRVVKMNSVPGNSTAKSVLRPLIENELDLHRQCISNQFDIVMNYAEDGDVNEYKNDFLRHDVFYSNFEGRDGRDRLEDDLTRRLEDLGDDMAPLLRSGEDDFWKALVKTYDESEAREMLPKHFEYTDTIASYQDSLNLTVEIGGRIFSARVEYTDEAIRCLRESESELREHLRNRVDEVYA